MKIQIMGGKVASDILTKWRVPTNQHQAQVDSTFRQTALGSSY